MKRSILLAVSMLLIAPSLDATSVQCAPSQGCPKGKKPPECCKPPPCEFYHELVVAKAMRNAFANQAGPLLMLIREQTDYEGASRIREGFEQDLRNSHKRFANCPPARFYREPPPLTVRYKAECQISERVGNEWRSTSADQLQATSNSCTEIVDARYAEQQSRQTSCQQRPAGAMPDIAEMEAEATKAADARVFQLEASLVGYWAACTITPDAEMARLVSKEMLDALKKYRQEARAKARAAKRAAARA